MKNLIKEHYLIIILSFLLTLLIFAPLIVFPRAMGKEYKGININWFGTDAHFYLTKGKEVLEGHGLGNPVLKEGKDEQNPYFSYSEYILLAPVNLLGLADRVSIVTVYNFYNFIGVFFLILLIYFFVWQLSRRKLLALAAALFMVGGYSLVYSKTLFYENFNIYARVIYPFFSSLILFIYFNLLVKSLNSDKLKYKILAGAFFGLLFYIYFYAWSFVLAFNVSLFIILFIKKDFLPAKKVLFISLIGAGLGAYNLLKLFLSLAAGSGEQTAYFMWASYSRSPIFSAVGFATLILFAIYYYKRRDDKNWPLILAIILSGWLALNQQVISGRVVQYGHYYWYFIVPLAIVISFYMIWQLVRNENLKKYLFVLLIVVALVNTAGGQYKSFFVTFEAKKYEQNFRPIIDALNRDKDPAVILAGQANAYLFTIYTSHDLFWQNVASISNLPIQRFKDALFVYYYLNKDARSDFAGYLKKIAADNASRGSFYQILYRNLEGYWSGFDYYAYMDKLAKSDKALALKRPAVIAQLAGEYETVLKSSGIQGLLKKYGVNYLIWDKNKNPEWDLSGLNGLKEVMLFNNIYLFSLADN